jgi:hypothetical protein
MGARWYDNSLGRWAQADPLVPDLYNTSDWDRFQYVRSNPQKYIDPSGNIPCGRDVGTYDECTSEKDLFNREELVDAISYDYKIDRHLLDELDLNELRDFYDDPLTFIKDEDNKDFFSELLEYFERKKKNQQIAAAVLIIGTDVFVGIPLIAVIVLSGLGTPPAIAAELLEVFVVLPINVFGIYLWLDAERFPSIEERFKRPVE